MLDYMLTTGKTAVINWTKYVSIFDLKNQEEPVVVKEEDTENVIILFPPFKVEIENEYKDTFKKGINKKIRERIINPTITCSNKLVVLN